MVTSTVFMEGFSPEPKKENTVSPLDAEGDLGPNFDLTGVSASLPSLEGDGVPEWGYTDLTVLAGEDAYGHHLVAKPGIGDYAGRRSSEKRSLTKVRVSDRKSFALRGYAGRKQCSPEEQKRLAQKKRIQTNTNFPKQLKRRQRALDALVECDQTATGVHHMLAVYKRTGWIDPGLYEHLGQLKDVVQTSLTRKQLKNLIQTMLIRGGVESNPGPHITAESLANLQKCKSPLWGLYSRCPRQGEKLQKAEILMVSTARSAGKVTPCHAHCSMCGVKLERATTKGKSCYDFHPRCYDEFGETLAEKDVSSMGLADKPKISVAITKKECPKPVEPRGCAAAIAACATVSTSSEAVESASGTDSQSCTTGVSDSVSDVPEQGTAGACSATSSASEASAPPLTFKDGWDVYLKLPIVDRSRYHCRFLKPEDVPDNWPELTVEEYQKFLDTPGPEGVKREPFELLVLGEEREYQPPPPVRPDVPVVEERPEAAERVIVEPLDGARPDESILDRWLHLNAGDRRSLLSKVLFNPIKTIEEGLFGDYGFSDTEAKHLGVKYEVWPAGRRLIGDSRIPIENRPHVVGTWEFETIAYPYALLPRLLGNRDVVQHKVMFSPHLVSHILRESPRETSAAVIAENARARMLRVASMPLADFSALNLYDGSELIVTIMAAMAEDTLGRLNCMLTPVARRASGVLSCPPDQLPKLLDGRPTPSGIVLTKSASRKRVLGVFPPVAHTSQSPVGNAVETSEDSTGDTSRAMPLSQLIATTPILNTGVLRNVSSGTHQS